MVLCFISSKVHEIFCPYVPHLFALVSSFINKTILNIAAHLLSTNDGELTFGHFATDYHKIVTLYLIFIVNMLYCLP